MDTEYIFRVEYADGTFSVESTIAANADQASREILADECEGHTSTSGPMGETVYCDGTCAVARMVFVGIRDLRPQQALAFG